MNIRQLEVFHAVFRAGSVSGAADALHTSQPSLSRCIADLEASIGFELFTRGRRGMVPTLEGRRFHEAVERSFIGLDRLRDAARIIAQFQGGELSIGAIPSIVQTALPKALARLQAKQPEQRVHITVGPTAAIINAVLLNEVDLGVVSTTYTLEGVEILFEVDFDVVCLVPEGHHRASNTQPVDLRALADGEWISYDRVTLEAMELEPDLVDALLSKAMVTSGSTPTVVAMARATSRLAIVDRLSASAEGLTDGLVVRPISQKAVHGLALIKNPNRKLKPPGRDLVLAFQEEARTVL